MAKNKEKVSNGNQDVTVLGSKRKGNFFAKRKEVTHREFN